MPGAAAASAAAVASFCRAKSLLAALSLLVLLSGDSSAFLFSQGGNRQKDDASLPGRCQEPSPESSFTIVTSASGRHFHDVTNVLTDSLRSLNVTGELLLYHENSYGARRGDALVDMAKVDELNGGDTCFRIRTFDLFHEVPWIEEFAHGKDTVFERMQLKTRKTYWIKWNMKAHLIFRKAAAIYHAITKVANTRFLIWLDTDVLFLKGLDAEFFDFVRGYDVSYIWRIINNPKGNHYEGGRMHAETGAAVYQVNAASRALLSRMIDYYRSPPEHEECLDDTCVFSNVVSEMVREGSLRDGHFATCAHRIGKDTRIGKKNQKTGRPWEQMVGRYYRGGPRTYACVGADSRSNVSPFNLFEYLIHLKGNKEYFNHIKSQLKSNAGKAQRA